MYARQTGAVPSGRRVSERPPPSSNVYISFCTISVASPTPRENSSVDSNVGRLDAAVAGGAEDPLAHAPRAPRGAQRLPGARRYVPRGAWITVLPRTLSVASSRRNGFVALLAPSVVSARGRGRPSLVRAELVDQRLDRAQQRRPVAAGKVHAPDRALEQDVAGEQRVLAADRVGDVPGAVPRSEDTSNVMPASSSVSPPETV